MVPDHGMPQVWVCRGGWVAQRAAKVLLAQGADRAAGAMHWLRALQCAAEIDKSTHLDLSCSPR